VWDLDRWTHFDRDTRSGPSLDETRARLAEKGV